MWYNEIMKIVTYNINGARASMKHGIVDWIRSVHADIICIQEIRANKDVCAEIFKDCGYQTIINPAHKKGYSGTMVLTKIKPLSIKFGFGFLDEEGRVITLDFGSFKLVNAYIPNGSSRLDVKLKFVKKFIDYISFLEKEKPVIICADMNTAQTELDLTNPKSCVNHSGFLQEERVLQKKIFDCNFVDILREKHHNELLITWRSYRSRILGDDFGWKFRFDYIYCSDRLFSIVQSANILNLEYSDHLPILVDFGDIYANKQ